MLARRLPSILPPMTWEECLEVTKIYSVVGLLSKNNPVITGRPFRAPHHTASAARVLLSSRRGSLKYLFFKGILQNLRKVNALLIGSLLKPPR